MKRRDFLLVLLGSAALLKLEAWSGAAEAVREPAPGSVERKAIMEALRGPVTKQVGKRVTFTGTVKIRGDWATFSGGAAPSDGVPPKDENVAGELELDLFALLRKTGSAWKVLHWGFAGDIGVMEEARKKFPAAPKALLPELSGR